MNGRRWSSIGIMWGHSVLPHSVTLDHGDSSLLQQMLGQPLGEETPGRCALASILTCLNLIRGSILVRVLLHSPEFSLLNMLPLEDTTIQKKKKFDILSIQC